MVPETVDTIELYDELGRQILEESKAWAKKRSHNDQVMYFIATFNGEIQTKEKLKLSNPVLTFKKVKEQTFNSFLGYLQHPSEHSFTNAKNTFLLQG